MLVIGLHFCNRLQQDLNKLVKTDDDTEQNEHKDEMKGRIPADKTDRESVRQKLLECVDPIKTNDRPRECCRCYSGNSTRNT